MTTTSRPAHRLLGLLLALAVVPACDGPAGPGQPDDPDAPGGKADSAAVEDSLERLTADGELSAADVREMFDAAGDNVSPSEMEVIEAALTDANLASNMSYTVAPDAMETGLDLAYRSNLFDYEVRALDESTSFGGTAIPKEVQRAVARARLAGAEAYDIRELKGDCDPTELVPDDTNPSEMVPQDCGKWAHYPAGSAPVGNMTYSYTEITPEKLVDDVNNGGNGRISFTGQPGEGSIFKKVNGQTWANNCALLSDGSLHCLPAHRTAYGVGLWLTNPALSRCPAAQFDVTTDANGDIEVEIEVEFFRMFLDVFQANGIVDQLFPERFDQAVDTINGQLAFEHQEADAAAEDAGRQARSDAEANGVTDPAELDAIEEEAATKARDEALSQGFAGTLGGLSELPTQEDVDYTEACKHILWHGHIQAQGNRVTSIGTSGRPSKRVGEGKEVLVDPAPVLRAWGFDVPTETHSEHSSVDIATDAERNILVEP